MPATPLFEIDDLHVATVADGTTPAVEVLTGVSLTVDEGEIHALTAPDRTAASTLAAALLGAPGCVVTSGRILFRGDDITDWGTDVRAKAGVFLAFADPEHVAGVRTLEFLQRALSVRRGTETSVLQLRAEVAGWMQRLGLDESLLDHHLNGGGTGGDKQRSELLHMAILQPDMAILDQSTPDLDADALRATGSGLRLIHSERPAMGALAIVHDRRSIDHLQPDHVHVLTDGRTR